MKEYTLVKSRSAAPSVTINAQHWAIWREYKCHYLFTTLTLSLNSTFEWNFELALHCVDLFMSLQETQCLAFIVALGATEWLITSVDFFHFPSSDPMFVYSRTGSNWMGYHQCRFFHVPSSDPMLSIYSRAGSNWMGYHQCRFFHVPSSDPMFSIYSRTGRNGMAYHQFGFFHVSSSDPMFSIYGRTGSNCMAFHQCGFFHVSLNGPMSSFYSHTGSNWMAYHQCRFFSFPFMWPNVCL